MTKQEAIERLKCIKLFMQINDKDNESKFLDEDYEANVMAIEAIEKQIPKEPSQLLKHTDYFHWECPICHMSYGMATQKVKYCYNCGQAIKWE